jgi:hypothetical protein
VFCYNNPVIYFDSDGQEPRASWWKTAWQIFRLGAQLHGGELAPEAVRLGSEGSKRTVAAVAVGGKTAQSGSRFVWQYAPRAGWIRVFTGAGASCGILILTTPTALGDATVPGYEWRRRQWEKHAWQIFDKKHPGFFGMTHIPEQRLRDMRYNWIINWLRKNPMPQNYDPHSESPLPDDK